MKKVLFSLMIFFSLNLFASIHCPIAVKCNKTECELPPHWKLAWGGSSIYKTTYEFIEAANFPTFNCRFANRTHGISIVYDTKLEPDLLYIYNRWKENSPGGKPMQYKCDGGNAYLCPFLNN